MTYNLIRETDEYVLTNEELDLEVTGLIEDQEKATGASQKLLKPNNLKGKISNKVSTLTKEHKFFTDNVSCPTCTPVSYTHLTLPTILRV